MKLKIERLHSNSVKKNFECGNSMLDNYIRTQAKQDVNKDLSVCFVLSGEDNVVKGYYTISASSVLKDNYPDESRRLPPSYETLPAILLGRLAVDKSIQKQGFGEILLFDSLKRSFEISQSLGTIAVIVDPIDENAEKFYSSYGFILLPGTGKMFLSMKTIKALGL